MSSRSPQDKKNSSPLKTQTENSLEVKSSQQEKEPNLVLSIETAEKDIA